MNFQQIRDFVNPAVGQATGIEAVDTLAMPVPTAHLMQAGGGGSITIDSELSETSTNPVENRVITSALKNLGSDLYFIINFELNEGTPVADKTYEEIKQAYMSSKIPVIVFRQANSDEENYVNIYTFGGLFSQPDSAFGFYYVNLDIQQGNQIIIYDIITINDQNVIQWRSYQTTLQPVE